MHNENKPDNLLHRGAGLTSMRAFHLLPLSTANKYQEIKN